MEYKRVRIAEQYARCPNCDWVGDRWDCIDVFYGDLGCPKCRRLVEFVYRLEDDSASGNPMVVIIPDLP